MKQEQIPGMSVAISVNGKQAIYHYGVQSKQTQIPVSDRTLYEIGSLSKPLPQHWQLMRKFKENSTLAKVSVTTYLN